MNTKTVNVIDYHTQGGPLRLLTDSLELEGDTMSEVKTYFQTHYHKLRVMLMSEPRGHRDMFGAVTCKPRRNDCDIGALFMDNEGSLNMCGHGIMSVAAWHYSEKQKRAYFKGTDEDSIVAVDTPAGKVTCVVSEHKHQRYRVSFRNVPAFLHDRVTVELFGRAFPVDIVFSGSFFGLVDTRDLDIDLQSFSSRELVSMGLRIRRALNIEHLIEHPVNRSIRGVDLIEFTQKMGDRQYDNRVVFGKGQLDRSPCGTGTTAKLVTLSETLEDGESLLNYSISGGVFTGEILGREIVDDRVEIYTLITGSTQVISRSQFVVNPGDKIGAGFLVQ